MTVHRLIYASRPFGFDAAMLGGILLSARRNNARDGITGALICRSDLYLQLIEGPRAAIDAAYARINRDDRHLDIEQLVAIDSDERLFPEWTMLDDPAQSWLWSSAEVATGALTAASPEEITAVFTRVAAVRREVSRDDASTPAMAAVACPAMASA